MICSMGVRSQNKHAIPLRKKKHVNKVLSKFEQDADSIQNMSGVHLIGLIFVNFYKFFEMGGLRAHVPLGWGCAPDPAFLQWHKELNG